MKKLTADTINGIIEVSIFESDVEIECEESFVEMLSKPFDGTIGASVSQKTYDVLLNEYSIR